MVAQNEATVQRSIAEFFGDETGATAIEYGLIAALISVGMLGALDSMGNEIANMWSYVSSEYLNVASF